MIYLYPLEKYYQRKKMKNITKRKSLGCIFQLTLFDKCVNDLYIYKRKGYDCVNF